MSHDAEAMLSMFRSTGMFLPANVVEDPELFKKYCAYRFSPEMIELLQVLVSEKLEDESRAKKKMIGFPLLHLEEEKAPKEKKEPFIFFVPAPFDASFCLNKETTLRNKVSDLCAPLDKSSLELHSPKTVKEALSKRTVVAFGVWNSYRIYELCELVAAWNALGYFAIPELIGTHHSRSAFTTSEMRQLQNLLTLEYDIGVSGPVLQCIKEVNAGQYEDKQKIEFLALTFKKFGMEDQQRIREYLEWIFTSALLMRGWKIGEEKYPIAGDSTRKLSEIDELHISYALEQLREIYRTLPLKVISWMIDLPAVEIRPLKLASGGVLRRKRKRSRDEDDEESDEEEEDSTADSTADEKVSTEDATVQDSKDSPQAEEKLNERLTELMGEPLCFTRLSFQPKEAQQPQDTKDTKDTKSFSLRVQLPDCLISSKAQLQETLQRVMEGRCYRAESKKLLQTSGYYLDLLFQLILPKAPLYCFEYIE